MRHLLPPHRFQAALRRFGREYPLRILDIGCGNNSPSRTKFYFPNCVYHGVDIQDYNLDPADKKLMDQFFLVNPDGTGYEQIPDSDYDLVVCNHVIEHIHEPYPLIRHLCRKLRFGGLIWLAFPSEKSLTLPRAQGTLHFSDDPTHVFIPSTREISNLLLKEGLTVCFAGQSGDAIRWLKGALEAAIQNLRVLTGQARISTGSSMWYYYGFESCVIAERRSATGGSESRPDAVHSPKPVNS